MSMYLPIAVIVISNVFYGICAKQTPAEVNPYASLTLTYIVGAVVSLAMFFMETRGGNVLTELHQANWTAWILGLAIVGLEAGSIAMYKAGWDISAGQLVASALLSICLLVIGAVVYKETVTVNKVLGILMCLIGIMLIGH